MGLLAGKPIARITSPARTWTVSGRTRTIRWTTVKSLVPSIVRRRAALISWRPEPIGRTTHATTVMKALGGQRVRRKQQERQQRQSDLATRAPGHV